MIHWLQEFWSRYKARAAEKHQAQAEAVVQMFDLIVGIISRLSEEDIQTIKKFTAVWRPYE